MRENKKVVSRESLVVSFRKQRATRDSRLTTRNSSRRGILLLVVLSLLTLFLMIGTAFIVTANQYRKMNKTRARITEQSQAPARQQKLLDEVINQLVRDTNNQNSVLRFHSLLRDLYGNDGFTAYLSTAIGPTPPAGCTWDSNGTNVTNGQILELNLDTTLGVTNNFGTNASLAALKQIDNAYNGLLVTFLDGPARGQSTRIVGYNGTTNRFRVMSFPLANGSAVTLPNLLNGSKIVVNGRPFNGTGAGYSLTPPTPTGAKLTAGEALRSSDDPSDPSTYLPVALMPNGAFFNPQNLRPEDYLGTGAYPGTTQQDVWNNLSANQKNVLNGFNFTGLGGSDESYDAVDFQNMALAMLPVGPVETVLPGQPGSWPTLPPVSLGNMILPSFHRPALLNYWANHSDFNTGTDLTTTDLGDVSNVAMLRKVLLRPNWHDHPNFTGSNPDLPTTLSNNEKLFRSIFGPWDVDNDNDGIRDSVWIDFGAPVMKSADGRLMKPMAALLVLDMDGRLNLNAHGTLDIANPTNFNESLAGGASSDILAQGQGSGTAEINLGPLMPGTTPAARWDWYRRFFDGAAANTDFFPNDSALPPATVRQFTRNRSGKMGVSNVPGQAGFDLAAQMKMQGMPRWATGQVLDSSGTPVLGGYASMPDLYGRYAVGLNDFGQPVSEAMVDYINNNTRIDQNSPYEIDLSLGASRGESATAADGPYSIAELERILRAYDPDAGKLPTRIWELAGEFKQNSSDTTPDLTRLNLWRTLLTTDSYDMPVPSVTVPQWMVLGPDGVAGGTDDYQIIMGRPPVGATFADLLEYRLRVGGVTAPAALRREMSKLLSPDLADGLRMDINRAIGNGRDDDNNGVVDEPGENEGAFWASGDTRLDAFTGNDGNEYGTFRDDPILLEDRNNDGLSNAADLTMIGITGVVDTPDEFVTIHNLRRQLLARHLYVLAMTLVDPLPTAATAADRQARARRLAQWAINIVDFRDPDNIMTAFEYDVNPFDGWDATIDGIPNATYASTGDPQLVWGSERPELLITETLAWHDLQIEQIAADTEFAEDKQPLQNGEPEGADISNDPVTSDFDLDQEAVPRGAFFLELYNPWPSNPGANADTHVKNGSGEDIGVNLSAFNIDPANPSNKSPVWRVMIYKNLVAGQDPDAPNTASQPAITDRDRCVYLTDFDPELTNPTWDIDGDAFYQEFPTPLNVRPGRYMVIGSGREASPGSGIYESPIVGPRQSGSSLNSRRVVLDASPGANNRVSMVDEMDATMNDAAGFTRHAPAESDMPPGNIAYPGDSSTCISDVAIINMPRRLTLSEPAEGYPRDYPNATNPFRKLYSPDGPPGYVSDPSTYNDYPFGFYGSSPILPKGIDVPLDNTAYREQVNNDPNFNLWTRFDEETIVIPGSIPNFRSVFLQRLANPLLPWNKETNPYRTVDNTSTNLTVISGREGPSMPNASANQNAENRFFSNERGWRNDGINPSTETISSSKSANPWGFESAFDPAPGVGGVNPNNPDDIIGVSATRPQPQALDTNSSAFTIRKIPECTLGFLNRPFFLGNPASPLQPDQPFPWLNWNNRPYINATELMQVPTVRSSQLLSAFSMESASGPGEVYEGTTNTYPSNPSLETDGRFGHLPNFFRNEKAAGGGGIVGLHRVLDYLHVPSRFVGTETWLNPTAFGDTTTLVNSPNDPRYQRQPPFNRISSYRDPGRVNLNTMANQNVYFGLMHGNPAGGGGPGIHPGPAWSALVDSRRGYGANQPLLQLGSSKPTFFDNPFRSADAGSLVPIGSMQRAELDCTAMRSTTGTTGATAVPLGPPLFATNLVGAGNAYRDTNRNPYFRYQPMTRLSNLVTTRSNVYAVWVTVGFFEVEAVPRWVDLNAADQARFNNDQALYNRVYPDGYTLGQEAGSETGDITRIREFALIDRTVPVAFEPGNNHNIDRAIRVRRRIE